MPTQKEAPVRFAGIGKLHSLRSACLLTTLTVGLQITTANAGNSPLADAAEQHNQAQLKQLLSQASDTLDVNQAQVDGMTALHWAAYHDDAPLAERLIDKGATVSQPNRYGITPLYLACVNGNGRLVQALLAAGADPNTAIAGGETALMSAARTGNVTAVSALITAGAEVDATEHNGQNAAMWAAAEGHAPIVEVLLSAGADFDTPLKKSGYNPFFFAVREGNTEIVRMLLAAGADINGAMDPDNPRGKLPKRGTSPVLLAVENGHYDLAIELLEAGADPNDERSGYTILHTLTWIRKPDIGESAAGDPEPRGSGRRTSLEFARELVLEYGANVNARLARGRKAGRGHVGTVGATPFFMASDRADLEYMKLLVELGADPLIPNNDGTTPVLVAAGIGSTAPEEEAGNEAECLAAVQYLVSLGADINTVDANGETTMHGAAYKNIPAVVHYLNEQGADIALWNTKNRLGWTPLLIAEGYRPGNFKPSFATADAITEVMHSHGVEPPKGPKPKHTNYAN